MEILELLLKEGVDPQSENALLETPAQLARAMKHIAIAEFLELCIKPSIKSANFVA
jgi:ankyrin repeat protein